MAGFKNVIFQLSILLLLCLPISYGQETSDACWPTVNGECRGDRLSGMETLMQHMMSITKQLDGKCCCVVTCANDVKRSIVKKIILWNSCHARAQTAMGRCCRCRAACSPAPAGRQTLALKHHVALSCCAERKAIYWRYVYSSEPVKTQLVGLSSDLLAV